MEDSTRWYRRLAGLLAARLPEARLGDIKDPLARRGRRWKLGAVVAGICAGAKSLAQLEKMTAEMGAADGAPLGRHAAYPGRLPSTAANRARREDGLPPRALQLRALRERVTRFLAPVSERRSGERQVVAALFDEPAGKAETR